jgi:hypothetical protein
VPVSVQVAVVLPPVGGVTEVGHDTPNPVAGVVVDESVTAPLKSNVVVALPVLFTRTPTWAVPPKDRVTLVELAVMVNSST